MRLDYLTDLQERIKWEAALETVHREALLFRIQDRYLAIGKRVSVRAHREW